MRQHGTRAKYVHDRCRCLRCRLANTRYQTARDDAARGPWIVRCVGGGRLWIVRDRHDGTIDLRTRDREAAVARRDALNREFETDELRERLWASGGTIWSVRRHLSALAAVGIGRKTIAAQAGVSRSRLDEIANDVSRNKARPRRRRLKMATAQRILGIPLTVRPALGARVPAGPTWALIDTLLRGGWTRGAIAMRLGAKRPALQLRRDFVLQSTADRVRALYAEITSGRAAA